MKPVLIVKAQRFLMGTALLFIVLALFAYQTSSEHVESVAQTLSSAEFVDQLHELFSAVQDAETGQRGYLLTGKQDYLTPFLKAKEEMPAHFAQIEKLVARNSMPGRQLGELHDQVQAKMDELEKTVRLEEDGQHQAAMAEVETGRGRLYMENVRTLVRGMEAAEHQTYKGRLERQRQRQQLLNTVLICSIAVALLFLFFAYQLSSRFAVERAKVEREIRSLNANLEKRVQARTAELEESTSELEKRSKELEKSNADLTQFAYVASHDLQEPLRMVGSYMGLLERRYGSQLDERANTYMRFAIEGALRMQALILDLLQYSRAGTQPLEKQVVQAEDLVLTALQNLDVAIRESSADIRYEPLPTVEADRMKVTLVFQNLISNAIKFRKDGCTPEIAIRAERKEDAWQFSVADNGIGFNPAYEDRIYEIFQRVHGSGQYSGNGIGLSICRRIIENHGGRLWAESKSGVGSVFHFTLPLNAQFESDPKRALG